jgi:hypothetical protein
VECSSLVPGLIAVPSRGLGGGNATRTADRNFSHGSHASFWLSMESARSLSLLTSGKILANSAIMNKTAALFTFLATTLASAIYVPAASAQTVRCFPVHGLVPVMTVDLEKGRIRTLTDLVYEKGGGTQPIQYRASYHEVSQQNGINKIRAAGFPDTGKTLGNIYVISLPPAAFETPRPGIAPTFRASVEISHDIKKMNIELQCEPASM